MAEEHSPTLPEEITSLTAAHSQLSVTHAPPPQTLVVIPPIPPPMANARSIETRSYSRLNSNPSGTHDIFFPLLKTKLATLQEEAKENIFSLSLLHSNIPSKP
ncbi:hypothetical protein CDL15_Pgr008651 [Punica granatum]|uniref:Uncharacterized protein n=1 Tax=Punica granatum TaxID=22663 RepID=A0A218XDG3_PUNGR|nr:hypothetical protein CDL15_Pgr008651 [Punica granatum]PKI67599.1 hypothetical protein CRG98_012022 [Punica granatum]